ncbi:MAG TPA: hypothetical protein VL866_21815 [Pyrinomonadaceae bacterium]|nr:hypothetical protein [Pyrinomonadaceae bacterium]
MGEVSVEGVADCLERLYIDPARRQELARAGYALTQKEEFSWDSVARKFDDLFVSISRQ